jgi:DNA repair exonuclease SbcCD nuclease subunit
MAMKIALISDLHLGFKWGTPRFEDAFEQAREAFTKALDKGADLILVGGDIFEKPVPPLEVLARTLEILNLRLRRESTAVWKDGKKPKPQALKGTPIISLHGNHEWRSKGQTNVLEALEAAGVLIYLNLENIVFETPDGKVAIHGMSYVPERYSREVLKQWNPVPVEGARNILLLHQSLGSFVFENREQARIQLGDLPPGFDLYVCGHVHCRGETRVGGSPVLFPGSTERTQLLEAEKVKGFYLVDLADGLNYEFVELETPRDFFFEELEVHEVELAELEKLVKLKIEEVLEKPRRNPKPPLIKLRLIGSLAKGAMSSEFDVQRIAEEFSGRALLEIDRTRLLSGIAGEKAELIRKLREQPLSLKEKTMRLLEGYLAEMVREPLFNISELYQLLTEEKEEAVQRRVEETIRAKVEAEVGS